MGKLLLLILILVAVWYGYRLVNRLQAERQRQATLHEKEAAKNARQLGAEDLAACGTCGVFVPIGARRCGRDGCPYPP